MATPTPALSRQQSHLLSQVLQDIRATRSHITVSPTPLSAFDSLALDALKDLFYMLNTEDPLSRLPLRRHMLHNSFAKNLLLPILESLYSDSSREAAPKRWSVPMYQLLRIFSVLTTPLANDNATLHKGCALDQYSLTIKTHLAYSPTSLGAFVALLHYYLERKAMKEEALVPAEDLKLENARIDNILRFFRNILAPPRPGVPKTLIQQDCGVHLAVVGALVSCDLYSTINLIFATEKDARSQYTDLVFLVSDIYALTFRHSSPREMHAMERKQSRKSSSDKATLPARPAPQKSTSGILRAALLKERGTISGNRSITGSARWMTRHSGTVTVTRKTSNDLNAPASGGITKPAVHRIVSAKEAVMSNVSLNPLRPLQELLEVNSELLCLQAYKGTTKAGVKQRISVEQVRPDLQKQGLIGIVALTNEMIESSFQILIRELRQRIDEAKQRSRIEENSSLKRAERALLVIVGSVVGFQREKHGKILPHSSDHPQALTGLLYDNCMKSVLSYDLKIVRHEWKTVEAGIELDTFKMIFQVLVQECEDLREHGKDVNRIEKIEIATFAVLEMMKMLQGMAAYRSEGDRRPTESGELTSRETALLTLEQLFERQSFLNAPAELAKDFNTKIFSFKHLTNIVEMAHAFTTILLDERELERIQVRKKRRKRKNKPVVESDAEEDRKEANSLNNSSGGEKGTLSASGLQPMTSSKEAELIETNREASGKNSVLKPGKRAKKIVESEDEEEADSAGLGPTSIQDRSAPALLDDVKTAKEADASIPATHAGTQDDHENKDQHSNSPVESNERAMKCSIGSPTEGTQSPDANPAGKGADCESNTETQVSRVQQMLLADQANGPSQNANRMVSIRAATLTNHDPNAAPESGRDLPNHSAEDDINELNAVSKVQSMLLADKRAEGNDIADLPPIVSTIEELRREKATNPEMNAIAQDLENAEASNDEDDDPAPEIKEVESVGIVRRFAHWRALQNLVIPIRTALCRMQTLSGSAYSVPEDSGILHSAIVIAKSAHVYSAVWKVAQMRERGLLCGQYFTFANMHLMNVIMKAAEQDCVRETSVLRQLALCAQDVTRGFFSWLTISPALALDMFFPLDKNSCHMYTSCMRNRSIHEQEQNGGGEDSGNDSETYYREIERLTNIENDRGHGSARRSKKRKPKKNRRDRAKAREVDRSQIEEDEDVDDLDKLQIGFGDEEAVTPPPRKRQRKARTSGEKKKPTGSSPPVETLVPSSDDEYPSDLDVNALLNQDSVKSSKHTEQRPGSKTHNGKKTKPISLSSDDEHLTDVNSNDMTDAISKPSRTGKRIVLSDDESSENENILDMIAKAKSK